MYPLASALQYSLFTWTGTKQGGFAGISNFTNLLTKYPLSEQVWRALAHNCIFFVGTMLIQTTAGLLFAVLLHRSRRGKRFLQTAYILPHLVSPIVAGYLWSLQFPFIKPIWTSSFVLATGGMSVILLAVFHQVIDVWGYKRWTPVFVWIGANAITLYLLNALMGFDEPARRIAGGDFGVMLDKVFVRGVGELLVNLIALGLVIALAGFLYRRKIFMRI